MDDTRIRQLTEEVLGDLRRGGTTEGRSLESRVAALETAVARLARGMSSPAPAPAVPQLRAGHSGHPALQLLKVSGSSTGQCVLEPEQPCTNSGCCKSLGY
jgi:hypothetical protein